MMTLEECVQQMIALPKGSQERRDTARLLHELTLRKAMQRDAVVWAANAKQVLGGEERKARRKRGELPAELCGLCGLPAGSCAQCKEQTP